MTILYLANVRLPTEKAHGVQIMKMCEALQRAPGVTVELVSPFRWRSGVTSKVRDVFSYYGVRTMFRVITLPSIDLFPLASLLPFLRRPIFFLQYGSFLIVSFLYLLSRDDARRRSTIFYTRDRRLARIALWFSLNVFFELHTLPNPADIMVARRTRGVITLTVGVGRVLREAGVAPERVLVSPDGVDLEAFEAVSEEKAELRKNLGLPPGMLIGYAGRLTTMGEEKGIGELLEAFALLRRTYDGQLYLCILGADEGEAARYGTLLDARKIRELVLFLPRAAPAAVPRYLKAFDVLVAPFPDRPHYRLAMSPLKIFEYLAAGRPIVVSDLAAIREVVSVEEAVFSAPGDPSSLAECLQRLLRDPGKMATLALNARRRAERFSWRCRADAVLRFLQEARA